MNFVALNPEQHSELKLPSQHTDYKFIAKQPMVSINLNEVQKLACEYPVLFTEQAGLVALMSVEADKNKFVNAKGEWLGRQMPESIALQPFRMAEVAEKVVVMIDEEHDSVVAQKGKPLFKKDGTPTKFMSDKLAQLEQYYQAQKQTVAFTQFLQQHNLLSTDTITITNAKQARFSLNGFRMVEMSKLNRLEDKVLADMERKGVLQMIHAHWHSLNWLADFIG